jgi:hypothetical protein
VSNITSSVSREQRHLVRDLLDVSRHPRHSLITLQAAQHHDCRAKQHHQRVLRHLARVHPLFAVPGLPAWGVLCDRSHPRPSRRHQPEHDVLVRLEQGSVASYTPLYSARGEDGALISGLSRQRWEGVYHTMRTTLGIWSLTGWRWSWISLGRGVCRYVTKALRMYLHLYGVALNTIYGLPSTGHTFRTRPTRARALFPRLLLSVRPDLPSVPGHNCGPPVRAYEHRPFLLDRR